MYNVQDIAFFIITLFARLYMRVGILPTCGKHLHGCIISLRGEAWANITSPVNFHWIAFIKPGKCV